MPLWLQAKYIKCMKSRMDLESTSMALADNERDKKKRGNKRQKKNKNHDINKKT